MELSKLYSKNISKIFKKNFDKDVSKFESDFLPVFVECCKFFNEDVATEIFNRFVTDSDREFKDALYNLVNVLELFEENYDVENDPLSDDEWEYLKLIINESTDELDIDLVKYIMQVMLDLSHL